MDSIPPERDATDIEFRRAVRIKIGEVSDAAPRASSLVAVCNKYDFIFVGFAQGFRVLQASGLDSRIVSSAKLSQHTVEDFGFVTTVALVGPPLHLAVSSDGLTLSVGIKKNGFVFAELYDIRAFAHQGKVSPPFLQVKLSSNPDDYLMDLAWNPGPELSSIFAACLSDGSVYLYEVKNTTLNILASLQATAQATCLCWSPKGKQLVVGKSTGELVQYDQQLKEKKVIPFPADVYSGSFPCSVVDVFWESTQVFFAAYHPRGGNGSQEQPWLVMITASKEGFSYVHHEDICYGSDSKSIALQKYYFHGLPDWDMIICSSSTALETSILGRQPENKSVWERCILADAGRPEIPMVDYAEHYPRGIAISLNSAHPVELNETQSLPSCPLLLLLSTDGTLLCFHVIYLRPGAAAITVVADKLTTDGERRNLVAAVEAVPKPSQPVAQVSHSAFGGQPSAGGQAIFGGQIPSGTQAVFGGHTSAVSQSVFGGQTSTVGQTAVGSLPALGNQTQPVFGGQASSGGQLAFGGQTANIGQPSAGQFGQAKGQPHPVSIAAAESNGQLLFGALAQSTAQMKPPSGLGVASGDGPKPQLTFGGLRGQTDLGFQPPKPAEQPLAGQTVLSTGAEQGSLFSKQLPSYSLFGGQKPQETLAATPKMQTAALPDLAKGLQTSAFASTPVASSIFGTSLNLGKPLDQSTPAHPVQASIKPSTTTTNASPASFSFPVQPKPAAQTAAVTKGLVSAGASKSPAGPSAVAPVAAFGATTKSENQESAQPLGKISADQSDYPFWKYIIDEVNQFNREVHELRSRASGISVDIGSVSEMETLRKKTSEESKLCKVVVEATHEKSEVVSEVKTQSLESWALFTQCCRVKERNCDPNYEKLMRERPLNPDCDRKLRAIHTMFQYVDSEQEKIDARLDDEWEAYLRKRKGIRLMETPPMHAIYNTLKNNNQTIRKQETNLESICARMQELNFCKSALRRNANVPFSTLTGNILNGESLKGDGDSDSSVLRHKGPNVAVIQEKEAKLRQILSCRKATPIVSTAPNNLSYSKIVSAKDLREILQSGNSPAASAPRSGSATSTGPAAAGIPGRSPTGRIVKAAVRSSPGQKETKPAEPTSLALAVPPQFMAHGRETAATGGRGLDLRNRQDPAKFFSQASSGTAVIGSGISQGNPVFGDLKSHVPVVFSALSNKAFSATAAALTQTRAPAHAETGRSIFPTQQMSQLPKYPSPVTSKPLESSPLQRKEGSVAVPSSTSRFSALPGTSQLSRQLFHSPFAEQAAAAEPGSCASEYDDEEDENDDEEYGDGYNTDVSQELTEHENEEAQPLPSVAPSKETKRASTLQKPIQNLFGLSSERSTGLAPASASGFVFGAKTDAEKAAPFAMSFGSNSVASVLTGGGFTGTQSGAVATTSVVGSSQAKSSTVLGGLLLGQIRDKSAVGAMSAGAFEQKAVSQAGNSLATAGDSKNQPSDSQNRYEDRTLTSAADVGTNDTKPTGTGFEKNFPSELEQNSSAANPETATSTAAETGLFAQGKTSSTGRISLFGQSQTTTTAVRTSIFGQALAVTAAVGTSVSGQAQTTTVGTSVFGQAQTTTVGASVFGQAQTTSADEVTLHGQTTTTTDKANLSGQVQTLTSTAGTGLFGQVHTTITSGTSLPGEAQTTASAAKASLFDQPSTTTSGGGSSLSGQVSNIAAANGTSLLGQIQTTPAGGTGLFGLTQTTTAGGTGLFGQAQTTTAVGTGLFGQAPITTAAGTGLFGLTQTTAAAGTGLFGQAPITTEGRTGLLSQTQATTASGTGVLDLTQTTTAGKTGLFGQPQTTTSAGVTGLFGQAQTSSSASGTGLFGQPQTTTVGVTGLLGQTQTTSSASGTGLFGQPQTTTSASGTGLFGQPQTATSANGTGLFGQPQTTTSASGTGLFGQPQTTTSASGTGLFGQPQTTTSASGTGLFGQPQTTTSASGTGLFGQPQTTTSASGTGLFGQPQTTTSASGTGLFGQPQTTTSASGTGLFGQPQTTTSASGTGLFGQPQAATSASGTGLFGQSQTATSASGTGLFGQPQTTTSVGVTGLFGQAQTASSASGTGLFGQPQTATSASGTGLFGQPQTTSGVFGFGQPQSTTGSGGLFGQGTPAAFGQAFGQPTASGAAATTGFGQTTSGTGSLFGQGASNTPSTAFGFGSSAFGSTSATSGQQGFGQAGSSAFGAPTQAQGSMFGLAESGGFGGFGGLGRQPDPEKAKQNVFGSSSTFGATQQTTGLFQQTTSSPFGLVKTDASISGAFSAGGSSIQSSGFGGFQKPAQQPTASAFGSGPSFGSPVPGFGGAPAFGSSPAFGGAPAFGSAPAFGTPPAFGSSAFGSPSAFGSSPGFGGGGAFLSSFGSAGGAGAAFGSSDTASGAFANFASTAAPSFDSLAMQSDQPTFGSPAQQQPQGFGGFGGGGGGAAPGAFGSGFGSGQNLPSTFSTYR